VTEFCLVQIYRRFKGTRCLLCFLLAGGLLDLFSNPEDGGMLVALLA
jgi:hypothetical protein